MHAQTVVHQDDSSCERRLGQGQCTIYEFLPGFQFLSMFARQPIAKFNSLVEETLFFCSCVLDTPVALLSFEAVMFVTKRICHLALRIGTLSMEGYHVPHRPIMPDLACLYCMGCWTQQLKRRWPSRKSAIFFGHALV